MSATESADAVLAPLEGARPARGPRKPALWRRAARVVERSLAGAGLLLLVYHGGFQVSEVISGSMAPTLLGEGDQGQNDWILSEQISTRFGPPPRFKLALFRNDDGVLIAKRVVGQAGERLRIQGGVLEVDGALRPLPDDVRGVRYTRAGVLRPRGDPEGSYEVPAGAVFVLGDDAKDSWDGRFFGGLTEERVRGRVVAVVWPPARWRWLW